MFLQLKGLKKIYEEEKGLKNLAALSSRIPAISFWKGRTSQAFRRSAVPCPRSSRAMRCFLI